MFSYAVWISYDFKIESRTSYKYIASKLLALSPAT